MVGIVTPFGFSSGVVTPNLIAGELVMSIVIRRRILATGVSCLDVASSGMQMAYFDNDIEGALTLMVADPSSILTQSRGTEDFDPVVELKAAKRRPASDDDEDEEEPEEEDDEEEDEDDFDDDEDDDLDDEDDDDEDDFGEESLNDDYDDDDLDEDDVYYDDDEVE
jgi:hypothetical protein